MPTSIVKQFSQLLLVYQFYSSFITDKFKKKNYCKAVFHFNKTKHFYLAEALSGKKSFIIRTKSDSANNCLVICLFPRRCLGSTQHLKNLYGAGYTLEVKLKHIESAQQTQKIPSINSPNGGGGGGGGPSMQPNNETTAAAADPSAMEQEERSTILRLFVAELFPDACLEESFADRLVYSVPQNAVSSLAQCFSQLERGIAYMSHCFCFTT